MKTTRRQFLQHGVVAAAACTASSLSMAIDPIVRHGGPRLRLSLAAYSYRRFLDLRRNPSMTLEQFIDAAARMPLDAVELTSYYFSRSTPDYLASLKHRCTRLGLDISGSAVGNDFCTNNPRQRQEQINHVNQWIENTARLGGKTLRIFAGRVPRGDTEDRARQRCIEAIEQVCNHARRFGVYVALENHGGITATAEQVLAIVRAVRSEMFGVNLDTGNFHSEDPYAELQRLAPYAVNVQLKTEIRRRGQQAEAADMARLVRMLRGANYRGYVALEYEENGDPRTDVPRYLAQLDRLIRA